MYVLTEKNFKTTLWAGGSTTQLFIFPETANYEDRDFEFRISSATITQAKSNFTTLPGKKRWLMPLSASIAVQHDLGEKKVIRPLEVHTFLGDWETKSEGECIDFNVMCTNGYHAFLRGHQLITADSLEIEGEAPCDFIFLYVLKGCISCQNLSEKVSVQENEILCIPNPKKLSLTIFPETDATVVEVRLFSDKA